jgi:hypothetical protein
MPRITCRLLTTSRTYCIEKPTRKTSQVMGNPDRLFESERAAAAPESRSRHPPSAGLKRSATAVRHCNANAGTNREPIGSAPWQTSTGRAMWREAKGQRRERRESLASASKGCFAHRFFFVRFPCLEVSGHRARKRPNLALPGLSFYCTVRWTKRRASRCGTRGSMGERQTVHQSRRSPAGCHLGLGWRECSTLEPEATGPVCDLLASAETRAERRPRTATDEMEKPPSNAALVLSAETSGPQPYLSQIELPGPLL